MKQFILAISLLFSFLSTGLIAQSSLLEPYGLRNFPGHYVQAVEVYFESEKLIREKNYSQALEILNAFWSKYPQGTEVWNKLSHQTGGIYTGHPPVYASLQMITKVAEVFSSVSEVSNEELWITVVIPQTAKAFDPANEKELRDNQGKPVTKKIDPRISQNQYRVLEESLWLFTEYLSALTGAKAKFQVRYSPLNITIPIQSKLATKGVYVSRPSEEANRMIWEKIDKQIVRKTDFWILVFPSNKPSNKALRDSIYVTGGGMASGPDGSPCILVDDQFLLKAQPHFKVNEKDFDPIERQLYIPQFLQHEIFHRFFSDYPEFGLEVESHQWHQRNKWPKDFVGIFESDYYQESFNKRIQGSNKPLIGKLRFQALPDTFWSSFQSEEFLGNYVREPASNEWHKGSIQLEGDELYWENEAFVRWGLSWNQKGELSTSKGNPYFESNPLNGRSFKVQMKKDEKGNITKTVDGFLFQNEFYRKVD